ncbi:ATP-grasp domain-containing protein [Streptomyces griseus]|uniref:ATP-grasp domain-containing protein n=1 Tax=Streptomyces griseus TaxID=1911 RepID=UPI000560A6CA|nr:ATP-grasp domain-containing protein [Streptomyces griseus]
MSKQRVLIVGGRIENVRKAKEQGYEVVFLQRPELFLAEHAKLVDAALLVDYRDWGILEPLITAAHQVYGFTTAVTTSEAGLEPAARINDLLGLGGVSHDVALLLRDKLRMRRHLASVAPEITVAAEELDGRESLDRFAAAHGYPFIVKPVDGIASLGLQLVTDEAELDRVWETARGLRGVEHQFASAFPLERFIMEEYVDGPEFSVEAFTFAGRHVIVAITEKLTSDNFVELGHVVPARVSPDSASAIERCVRTFLDAIGLQEGPSHTEVRLSGRGPRVIESHNRPGGDRIRDLVEAAYGFDIERYTVAWASGTLPALESRPPLRQAAATRFLSAEPGTVTAVEGLAEAAEQTDVLTVALDVAVGDTVRPLRSSWDRIGQVVAVGPDADAALARCEKTGASVVVRTEVTADAPE